MFTRMMRFLGATIAGLLIAAPLSVAGPYDPVPEPPVAVPTQAPDPSPAHGAALSGGVIPTDDGVVKALRDQVRDLQKQLDDERRRYRLSVRNLRSDQAARELALRKRIIERPDVEHAIELGALAYGVPPGRLKRIAWCESNHVPTAQNGRYLGLFQFGTWLWGQSPFGAYERTDPLAASFAAAWAFSRGYDRHWPICGRITQ